MNDKIKQHIVNYCNKNGYPTTDAVLCEVLRECGYELYREIVDHKRWWNEVFVVVEIDGMEIGFFTAITTGDNSPEDLGWEFNLSDVCMVDKYEVVKTIYKPKWDDSKK